MANNDKNTLRGKLPGNVVFGVQGESAYQVAVRNGYMGTELEWLESLRGPAGIPTDAQVQAAVNQNLAENPIKPGATAEQAAQIQANTDAIEELKKNSSNPDSEENAALSDDLKTALIDYYTHVMPSFDDANGLAYINAILTALGAETREEPEEPDEPVVPDEPETPEVTLSSISATYSGGDVAVGTALTDLTGIVVTAHYSDSTSKAVTGYTLSGEIAEGSNTVTVNYGGKTATFTVTGVAESGGESNGGVSSINHFAARKDGQTTGGGNYIEPDNGYIIISNTTGHTGVNAGTTNLFAWPLISGKTYSISVGNADTATVYYGLCASTLDATPVKGEITTVTDTVVKNIAAWGWATAENTTLYSYTAGDNEYLLFWPNKAGVLTITAEVAA